MSSSNRKACVALALGAMATVMFTACGGDDSSTAKTDSGLAAEGASSGISPDMPIERQLALTFPVPKAGPEAPPGAASAIAAGRRACQGKTPLEVREQFIDSAKNLTEEQSELIAELPKYEKQAGSSPSFAAGQLAAGVYEATLPEKQMVAGYQGCVYELALQLRRELAKQAGKGPSE